LRRGGGGHIWRVVMVQGGPTEKEGDWSEMKSGREKKGGKTMGLRAGDQSRPSKKKTPLGRREGGGGMKKRSWE